MDEKSSARNGLRVMKFGGSSVADADKIKHVARRVAEAREAGDDVLAVVSARGKTTDGLVALAREISDRPDPREMDMLLSTGERISCALVAMALHDLGHGARSFTGSQAGILTDDSHTKAKILEIRAERLRQALDEGHIVLVAGFQGMSSDRNVTTLGRGGSDTTAVALATALDAEVCEIYTDVTGVFTADPRIEPGARKLSLVSHEEMLEMAAMGSKVLALRSVEVARRHDIPLHVRSSFLPEEGTWIRKETPGMEKAIISGISHKSDEAKVTISGVENRPGVAARIFTALADRDLNVDTIIQNVSDVRGADVSFTVPLDELVPALDTLESLRDDLGFRELSSDDQIGKVTLVGAGMKSEPGVAAKMFRVLADEGINLQMIDTSTIRITVVIDRREVERAVRALHDAFDLASEAARREAAEAVFRADV
jgi:aspartate kinase